MTFHIISIFPKLFDSYLSDSIIGRALKNRKIKVKFYNPRDFTRDQHKKVDDSPYGGGPGMVMSAEPILLAHKKALGFRREVLTKKRKFKTIIFSPRGNDFTNVRARDFRRRFTDIIMICGRYEGIDVRVKKILRAEEISIGDYVLTGGEIPALVLIDSITRQIPGVLGKRESLEEERVSSREIYTRPAVFTWKGKKYKVPPVLLSGDHKKIEQWKKGS